MVIALLLATGCYSQADYADDASTAICDWYDRCELLEVLTYDDVDTCLAALSPPDTGFSCLEYDSAQAKDCVEALESAGCEETARPSACDTVCQEPVDTADTAATAE